MACMQGVTHLLVEPATSKSRNMHMWTHTHTHTHTQVGNVETCFHTIIPVVEQNTHVPAARQAHLEDARGCTTEYDNVRHTKFREQSRGRPQYNLLK